jgi:hypothetical protein
MRTETFENLDAVNEKGLILLWKMYLQPNPDKPELNIDDLRLKICGIASLCLYY